VAILEPYRAVVLVPRSHGDARAFLRRGWAWSHVACGDSRALSCWVTGSEHVATPEPFPDGLRARCLRAHGNTRALSWRVAHSVPWGTW
jgi:hypothetical protein